MNAASEIETSDVVSKMYLVVCEVIVIEASVLQCVKPLRYVNLASSCVSQRRQGALLGRSTTAFACRLCDVMPKVVHKHMAVTSNSAVAGL